MVAIQGGAHLTGPVQPPGTPSLSATKHSGWDVWPRLHKPAQLAADGCKYADHRCCQLGGGHREQGVAWWVSRAGVQLKAELGIKKKSKELTSILLTQGFQPNFAPKQKPPAPQRRTGYQKNQKKIKINYVDPRFSAQSCTRTKATSYPHEVGQVLKLVDGAGSRVG